MRRTVLREVCSGQCQYIGRLALRRNLCDPLVQLNTDRAGGLYPSM